MFIYDNNHVRNLIFYLLSMSSASRNNQTMAMLWQVIFQHSNKIDAFLFLVPVFKEFFLVNKINRNRIFWPKILLDNVILFATCLLMALHALYATYLATSWACNDCTEYPGVTRCNFSCILHLVLQKSCYMLQSWAATCYGFKTIHTIVAESGTELHFVRSLQVQ